MKVTGCSKLQALVYDVLPSTIAVFSYAIGSRKLSANEQFFVGAQTVMAEGAGKRCSECADVRHANKTLASGCFCEAVVVHVLCLHLLSM